MRKKLLAGILAASMAFSLAPVLPVNTGTVAAAEDVNEVVGAEDKSAVWWSAFSKSFQLESDKVLVVDFDNYGNSAAVWNNYVLVFTNDGTTTPADDSPGEHKEYAVVRADNWGWGGGENKSLTGDAITYTSDWTDEAVYKEIMEDAHVTLEVARKGSWIQVSADVVSNKDETKKYSRTATLNTDAGDVYLTFTVDASYLKLNTVDTKDIDPNLVIGPSTEDPGTPSTPATSDGTDFSAIETQPVVKYTFDNADGLELAGEAKVEEGALKLATTGTMHETYAKIADITSNDFSNGITLTTDFMVAGWTSDWTPIFMMGDGTLGGMADDATMGYHLTQGFSSREDKGDVGYFGNAVAAPYTWDFFSNAANWNTWYTLTLTVSPTKMTTYINGVQVQTLDADYSGLLANFSNVAKNNYLGTSYWADADFVGSLDNVGIYNTALSAEDVAALVSAEPATPVDPGNNGNDEPTPSQKTMKITKVTAKKNATKITGTVSVAKATVKVKVGSKAFKKATVSGKKFTIKVAKLKKGTTIKVKATKSGYKAVTKTVKVK